MSASSLTAEKIETILSDFNVAQANNGSPNKLTIHLAKTEEDFEKVFQVAFRAFRDYAFFEWMTEGLSREDKDVVVSFLTKFVRHRCRTVGFILIAKDEKGEIVGSAQFENRCKSRNGFVRFLQSAQVGVSMASGMCFGSIGFPTFMFSSKMNNFKRRMNGFDFFDKHHEEVISSFDHHLYLIMLSSDPDRRGQGIGPALLSALAGIADSLDVPIYLETDTDGLKAFYERNGYALRASFVVPDPEKDFKPNFGMFKERKSKRSTDDN